METKYKTLEDFENKLQRLKGRTKLKYHQNIRKNYAEMNYRRQSGNFHFEEDPISNGAEGIAFIMHET